MLAPFKKFSLSALLALMLTLCLPVMAFAEGEVPAVDSGDTAWILISTALVLFMFMPGLGLFYGGLVSQRNILSTSMYSLSSLCIVTIVWVLWGYSLAFGPGQSGITGGFDFFGLNGVGQTPKAGTTIPHLLFAAYQGMFAAITTALISGGVVERMKFKAWIVFSVLWPTFVYAPMAHWAWGGGWLSKLGGLDFAGGTVVHILSGVSALIAALVIGPRLGFPSKTLPPHNLIFFLLGAMCLWFGWFGFNAGSALASGGLTSVAFLTTQVAGASGGLIWMLLEWKLRRKPTLVGAVTGAIGGLVAITPAAGYVSVLSSIVIGGVASFVCYWALNVLKAKFKYDDSLDVFGIHGIGGIWGAVATGIFASKEINPAGADGLIHGNPMQVIIQLADVAVAILLAAVGTFILLKIIGLFTPLRVTSEEEIVGLDISLHGEYAYNTYESGKSELYNSSGQPYAFDGTPAIQAQTKGVEPV